MINFKKEILINIDFILSILGIIGGFSLIFISFLMDLSQYFIGITLVCTCFLYLTIRRKANIKTINIELNKHFHSILNISFLIICAISILIWHSHPHVRPFSLFLLLCIMAGAIALEILIYKEGRAFWYIFPKIIVFSLIMRIFIYYNYPSIIGYDTYEHLAFSNIISNTGNVAPLEISDKYFNFPILHTFIAETQMILSACIKDALFYSIGISSVFSIIFVYLIGKKLINFQIGLISALLFSISNEVVARGVTNIIPDSLVICFTLLIIYLLLCVNDQGQKNRKILWPLIYFIALIVIITHQMSAFITLVFVFSYCFAGYFSDTQFNNNSRFNFQNITFIMFFSILMLFYWIIATSTYYRSILDIVISPFSSQIASGTYANPDTVIYGASSNLAIFDILFLNLSYLIFPFFGIGGLLYLSSKKEKESLFMVVSVLIMFFLIYCLPLIGLENFLYDRMLFFIMIFLSILSSIFILILIKNLKSNIIKILSFSSLIMIITFFMIFSPTINTDNPIVAKEITMKTQFTDNEIYSASRLLSISQNQVIIDSSYILIYRYLAFLNGITQDKFYKIVSILDESDIHGNSFLENNDIVILRENTKNDPISIVKEGVETKKTYQKLTETVFIDYSDSKKFGLIFDSGSVNGFLSENKNYK